MPRLLPQTVEELVALVYETELTDKQVANKLNISRNSVARVKKNMMLFGDPYPPSGVVGRRPRILNPAQEQGSKLFGEFLIYSS